jgi:hypothetical protein
MPRAALSSYKFTFFIIPARQDGARPDTGSGLPTSCQCKLADQAMLVYRRYPTYISKLIIVRNISDPSPAARHLSIPRFWKIESVVDSCLNRKVRTWTTSMIDLEKLEFARKIVHW